jgi:ABC-type dipeptide/oligopeptide/nickel transport system ATPase subunit
MEHTTIQYQSTPSPENEIQTISSLIPAVIGLVRIDGHSGVGKSRIARALAAYRGWQIIEVDHFLVKSRPGRIYATKVNLERLAKSVNDKVRVGTLIVEGLCLDQLLPMAEFGSAYRIYVQSMAHGDGASDEADRNVRFGTDLYYADFSPDTSADLVISVPYGF